MIDVGSAPPNAPGVDDVIYEPFIGGFTGKLKTFIMKDKRRLVFEKMFPIVKNMGYVLKFEKATGKCTIILIQPGIPK